MSVNVINLSGQVDRVFYSPAGKTLPSGQVMRYPDLTLLVTFQNVSVYTEGTQITVPEQKLRIKVNMGEKSAQQGPMIESKFQQGCTSFLMTNGTFSNWTNRQNQIVSEIKVAFNDMKIGNRILAHLNSCVIHGKVIGHQGPWIQIEERYRNPSEQDPAKQWKSRIIPVFYWTPPDRPIENLNGQYALAIGRLSVHTPVLQQDRTFTMAPYLHVVATEVHACLG